MNYSNTYSYNNPNFNLLPFQMRFENCLKDPIVQKCNVLSHLIQESITTNLKEIQINFMALVEDIFGLSSRQLTTDWSLKLISRNYNPREFDAIYTFLQPNGTLFQLIRQLMNDPLNRFEFPKSLLPIPTKLSLEEGVIPTLYANKISHVLSNTISVNAFEFFLFHFSYHMVNNSPALNSQQNPYYLEQLNNANINPSNIVYFALLESYLNCFVPISSNPVVSVQSQTSQSSLWQSLSSTTSSLLHLGTNANTVSPKQMTASPQTSTLFKSSILNLKPLLSGGHEHHNSEQLSHRLIHDSLGSEIGKCETFLLIVTEIWLNHAVPHSLAKRHSNSPSKQQYFTPNSDHMRAVRILVKHLHYFANSCAKRQNDSLNIIESTPLDDMKPSIWSTKYVFQKKLYTFLRMSFERWPNDTSFRLPLETWLSYIQPWRYTNATITRSVENDGKDVNNINAKSDIILTDDRWKQFISDNLLFYSVIFRQLIPRFSKLLDLNSSKNALMLFRLTKVFSQKNLSLWIREVENSLMNSETSILQNSWVSNSRGSLLTPTIRQQNVSSLATNLRHPLIELESNNFEYIPLFCPAIKPLILQLLIEISKVLNIVNEMITKAQLTNDVVAISGISFIQYMTSFFNFSEELTQSDENKRFLTEKTKTKNHLQISSLQLSQLFEVPAPDLDITLYDNQSMESNDENTPLRQKHKPLYEERDGTPKLTSFGRTQVLNKACRPQLNLTEGNPDKQPVRTYELYYFVQLLTFISDLINRKYGQTFENLYNKEGFVGIFFKQLITGPTSYVLTVRADSGHRPPDRVTQQLGPRINLRFMANKAYLFYIFVVYLMVYLLNYKLISFSCLLFAMYFTYLATKAFLINLSSN